MLFILDGKFLVFKGGERMLFPPADRQSYLAGRQGWEVGMFFGQTGLAQLLGENNLLLDTA